VASASEPVASASLPVASASLPVASASLPVASASLPVLLSNVEEITNLVKAREVYESSQSNDDEKYHVEEAPKELDVSLIEPVVEIHSGAIPEPSQFSVFNTSPDISADVRRCLNKLLEPRISSVSGQEEKRDEL